MAIETPGIEYTQDETGQPRVEVHGAPMDQVRRQVAVALAADTDGKVRQVLIELGWAPPEVFEQAVHYLQRYQNETPLGNQPHMIAHKVDDFLAANKKPRQA